MADSPRTDEEFLKVSGRCWSVPDGSYLVEGAPGKWPHNPPSEVERPGGQFIQQPSAYYASDNRGEVTITYSAPYAYSLEDTLYVLDIYAVLEGQLLKFLWVWPWKREPRVSLLDTVLTGLVETSTDGISFDINRIPAPK